MIAGHPEGSNISTSYVERQNLTMRMGMRRFTRLTSAFSKKVENHAHAVSLHFMRCNFARRDQTLKGATPGECSRDRAPPVVAHANRRAARPTSSLTRGRGSALWQ